MLVVDNVKKNKKLPNLPIEVWIFSKRNDTM